MILFFLGYTFYLIYKLEKKFDKIYKEICRLNDNVISLDRKIFNTERKAEAIHNTFIKWTSLSSKLMIYSKFVENNCSDDKEIIG